MAFELPNLPYAHNALEPHIDVRTMEIHHGKHHAGYTSKLNAAVEGTDLEGKDIETLLREHSDNGAVRNNGGGFWNHTLFWNSMSPNGGGAPEGALAEAIDALAATRAVVPTPSAGKVFALLSTVIWITHARCGGRRMCGR